MTEADKCPVCKEVTHPNNFIYDPKGAIVGCKRCSGKPPVSEAMDDKKVRDVRDQGDRRDLHDFSSDRI